MAKYVTGMYQNQDDISNAIQGLMDEGYPRESITLIGNKSVLDNISDMDVAVESSIDYTAGDESVWQRIKDFFGFENEVDADVTYKNMLASHKQDIEDGNVLIVVDDAVLAPNLTTTAADRDTQYWNECATCGTDREKKQALRDDETLRLQEERMDVDKQNVQAGEVVVTKRVVEHNETINVPLRHEEVVIERRPLADGEVAASATEFGSDTMSIPLWEEQVNVSKHPVVTEEVRIHKNNVETSKQVSANLRREELDVQKEGNVVLRDSTDTDTTRL